MIKRILSILTISLLLISCPTAPPLDPTDQYEAYMTPSAPESVNATNGYDDTITLSWADVENATSYQVWGIESVNYGAESSSSSVNESYGTLLERGFHFLEDTNLTTYTLDATSGPSYVFSVVALRNIGTSATDSSKTLLYSNPSSYVEGSTAGDVRISGIANSNSAILYWSVDGIESVLSETNLYSPVFTIDYKQSTESEWKGGTIAETGNSTTDNFYAQLMASSNNLTPNTNYDFRVNMIVYGSAGNEIARRTSETFTILTDVNLVPENITDISATTNIPDEIEISFTAPAVSASDMQSYFRLERGVTKSSFETIAEGNADIFTESSGVYTYRDTTAEVNTEYYYRVINGFENENGNVIWQSDTESSTLSNVAYRTWRAENASVEITNTTTDENDVPLYRELTLTFEYGKEITEDITFSLTKNNWSEESNKTVVSTEEIPKDSLVDLGNGKYSYSYSVSTLEQDIYQTFTFDLNTLQSGSTINTVSATSDLIDLGRSTAISFISSFSASDNYAGKVLLSWTVPDGTENENYTFYIDENEVTDEISVTSSGTERSVFITAEDQDEHEYRIFIEAELENVRGRQYYPYPAYGRTLSVPSGLTASDGESIEGINITFTGTDDPEVIYNVEYSENGSTWNSLGEKNEKEFFLEAKGTSEDGKEISFRVRARNTNDTAYTEWSDLETGSVFGPGAMNLQASYETSGEAITLTWESVEGANSYRIERNGVVIRNNVRNATEYSDSDFLTSTTLVDGVEPLAAEYTYNVIPLKEVDGEEIASKSAAEAVGKLYSPPVDVTVSKGEYANYVHLEWTDSNEYSDGNTYYIVKRYNLDESGNETDVTTFSRTRNTFFDDTRPSGKAYYTVMAQTGDLTSCYQNTFSDVDNIFGETEEGNLGYELGNVEAPVIMSVVESDGYLAPYVQLTWERVDGATSYDIIANISNPGSEASEITNNVDVSNLPYDSPNSDGLVTTGIEGEPGYLTYDTETRQYTYNDNSGMMRTTTAISSYSLAARNDTESSDIALTRSTTYRSPRTDEYVSMANEMAKVALNWADDQMSGEWFDYGYNNDFYYYPDSTDPTFTAEKPKTLGASTDIQGRVTFDSYEVEDRLMSISGSFTTETDGFAASNNPLMRIFGNLSISFDPVTIKTGETGNIRAAEITYPTINVHSSPYGIDYSITVDGTTSPVTDSSDISRIF